MAKETISVVIPCYNEAATVADVLSELSRTLRSAGVDSEVIVVDDGSTDGTGEVVAQTGLAHRTIRHKSNRGYGAALKAGIRAASRDLVAVMDADGQHDPANIVHLMQEAEDCDMVIGARQGVGSPHWRRPGKFLLRKLCEFLVGARIPDINSGLRLFRKAEAQRYLHLCSDQFSFSTSITLAFLSDRLSVRFVPVQVRQRQGGASQVRIKTGFTTLMLILRIIGTFNPLPIFMPPTVALLSVGSGLTLWGLFAQRNVSDTAVLCILASMILFCFGLLADQLALLRREISKS